MAIALGWPDKVDFDWPDIVKDAGHAGLLEDPRADDWGHFKFT